MRKIRIASLLVASFLGFTISIVHAQQLELKDNVLNLGVREVIPTVEEFCKDFRSELERTFVDNGQSVNVATVSIENQYRGAQYPRFAGLKDGSIDVECGPNSIGAENLEDPNTKNPHSENVEFTDRIFAQTSIKLLLRRQLNATLEQLSGDQLTAELGRISIGVLSGTTTQEAFEDEPQYEGVVFYTTSGSNEPPSLEKALDALDSGEIDAIASDGIILSSFLKNGIIGNNEPVDTKYFRKERPPYEDEGFTLFPSEGSLPGIPRQQYGIAIRKDLPQATLLKRWIDDALSNVDMALHSSLVESGAVQIDTDTSSVDDPNDASDTDLFLWWGTATLIFIFLVVLVIRYPNKLHATLTSKFGSVHLEGLKENNSPHPGVDIRNVKTNEGSLTATENSDNGISVVDAEIQKDITLTSGRRDIDSHRSHSFQTSSGSQKNTNPYVECRGLISGRDITINQFSQDIGNRNQIASHAHQIDKGFEVWKSLLDLRYASDDLWEIRTERSLLSFSRQLSSTRKIVHREKDIFNESERRELSAVIQSLGNITLGRSYKLRIRQIQSEEDIRRILSTPVITRSMPSMQQILDDVLESTEDYRFDYEQIVETVGISLKQRLSSN